MEQGAYIMSISETLPSATAYVDDEGRRHLDDPETQAAELAVAKHNCKLVF